MVMFSIADQGPIEGWALTHAMHHVASDTYWDPHNRSLGRGPRWSETVLQWGGVRLRSGRLRLVFLFGSGFPVPTTIHGYQIYVARTPMSIMTYTDHNMSHVVSVFENRCV